MSMTPEEYLAIPYVLVMESVEKEDGDWIRRAEYPELPGCVAEAFSPLDAIDQLEEKRVRFIMERLERGEPIPVPRPPLRASAEGPDQAKLGFAKWLVDQRRITDDR
jgi:predicted RNase H-like HicB family nuclease